MTNLRKSVHAQEEAQHRRNHHKDAGDARRRKDQLLAKMREIDLQNEEARNPVFVDSSESSAAAAAETPPSPARRRSLCSPKSDDDWIFASYAPSLGNPRQSAAREDGDHALEAIGVFSLKGAAETAEKNKKSSLMQQLFGSLAAPLGDARTAELLDGVAGGARGSSRAAGRFGTPAASLSARHVVDSRPAVRVIPSFDDDIEELTL